jgi:hypothetical protein
MDVNKKSWGTVIVFKNGDTSNKRYDKQKSVSIRETGNVLDIFQIAILIENLIPLSRKYNFEELLNKLKELEAKK